MKRTVAALWRYDRKELLAPAALTLGCWLLVEIVTCLVMRYDTIAEVWPVGAAAALYGGALFCTVFNGLHFALEYDFLLQFPLSRRAAMAALLTFQLGQGLLSLAAAALLTMLETPLHRALYGATANAWMLTPWWAWPVMLVLPVLLAVFAGGVLARFRRRGGWALYLLFISLCISCSSWLDPLVTLLTDVPALLPALLAALTAALLLLAALGARWLLRTAVQAG